MCFRSIESRDLFSINGSSNVARRPLQKRDLHKHCGGLSDAKAATVAILHSPSCESVGAELKITAPRPPWRLCAICCTLPLPSRLSSHTSHPESHTFRRGVYVTGSDICTASTNCIACTSVTSALLMTSNRDIFAKSTAVTGYIRYLRIGRRSRSRSWNSQVDSCF
jgi:hypothetical protein